MRTFATAAYSSEVIAAINDAVASANYEYSCAYGHSIPYLDDRRREYVDAARRERDAQARWLRAYDIALSGDYDSVIDGIFHGDICAFVENMVADPMATEHYGLV